MTLPLYNLSIFSASDSQSDHNSGPEEAAASKPGEPPDIVKSSGNLNRRGTTGRGGGSDPKNYIHKLSKQNGIITINFTVSE